MDEVCPSMRHLSELYSARHFTYNCRMRLNNTVSKYNMARTSRKPVTIEHLNLGVQKMIDGKTHREIAILGGALLEGMLFDLLKSSLVDSPYSASNPQRNEAQQAAPRNR
jgi:hypothetical protein